MQPFTRQLFFVYFLSIAFVFLPFITFGTSSSTEGTTVSGNGFAGIIESLHLDTLFQSIKENNQIPIGEGKHGEFDALNGVRSLPIGKDTLNNIKTPDLGVINKNVEEETGINVPKFFRFLGKVAKAIFSFVTEVFTRLTQQPSS